MAKDVYNKKEPDSIVDESLALLIASALIKEFEAETKVTTLLVEENLTQFAVHKAFWNEKEIRQLIIANPNISFEAFKEQAKKINELYNDTHLKTEFDTTKRSGEMFRQWQTIESEKETKPFLQYKTQEDSRVRHDHSLLNDIIRPVGDDFWLTFFPPCDYNCRCYVIALEKATVTPVNIVNRNLLLNKKISKQDVDPVFRNNVGKTNEVFTKKHPYFKGISKEEKEVLAKTTKKILARLQ